jgi:intraflagellar transport protein 52
LVVVGSGTIFADQFLEKEDNTKIMNVLFDFLTTDTVKLHQIDSEDPEISDYYMIPDSCMLSDRLRVCLQVNASTCKQTLRI